MGCGSCGTAGGCSPKGCKNNGTCGTSGCNKLNVYDWLGDMELPEGHRPFDIVEVRFKGNRKEFYRNTANLSLYTGDHVVVQLEMGQDIGQVSLSGELVRLQLKKYNIPTDSDMIREILRIAGERDMARYNELKEKEAAVLERARTIALQMKLNMKLSDIEFQGDGRKVTFFYTAEERVDFRALIRQYADEFKTRIEMRQIGYRHEAARLGGIGSCGRELCCSTWLSDLKQVSTSAARYQNLSINMAKLSGQCGRLKCCLNFELDNYMEALQAFPKAKNIRLNTVGGTAYMQKVDILKKLIWFSYPDNQQWVALPAEKVNDLVSRNENGETVENLHELAPVKMLVETAAGGSNAGTANGFEYDDDTEDLDITRLDRRKEERRNQQQKNQRDNRNRNQKPGGQNRQGKPGDRPQNRTPRPPGQENRGDQNRGDRNKPQGDQNKGDQQRRNDGNRQNPRRNDQPRGDKPRNDQNRNRNNQDRNRNPQNRNENRPPRDNKPPENTGS